MAIALCMPLFVMRSSIYHYDVSQLQNDRIDHHIERDYFMGGEGSWVGTFCQLKRARVRAYVCACVYVNVRVYVRLYVRV